MSGKRGGAMNAFHCEETREERWSTRVYRDLIGLGFGRQSCCKQHMCAKMKERLDQHRMHCPASKTLQGAERGVTDKTQSQVKHTTDQSSSTARKLSIGVSTRRPSPHRKKSKIHSAQTNLTFADFSPLYDSYDMQAQTNTIIDNLKPGLKKSTIKLKKETSRSHNDIPVKLSETHEILHNRLQDIIPVKPTETHQVLPGRNLYRDRLNREIHEFFYDIPVFPNTGETVKQKRSKIIDKFVCKIADLYVFMNDEDYDDKVEHEIDECLRNLPMWEPQLDKDRTGFKNYLGDSLFKFIKTFNKTWCDVNRDIQSVDFFSKEFVSYNNYRNYNLEKTISDWVEMNVHDTNNRNEVVTNALIKKLRPILESGTNGKHMIKTEIVNILEGLSMYLHSPINKDIYVNILAGDLENLLCNSGDKYGSNATYSYKRDRAPNDPKLRDKIEDETISQITDILFSNDDLALHDTRQNVVNDIRRILKSSAEFTDSEASSLAQTLVTNLKDFFHEELYVPPDHKHSSSFVVLTSEQDLSNKSGPKFYSTPTTFVKKKDISTLNKAEKVFIEKVSVIIRAWLDTTDVSFETMEEQRFKETIVNDIANDVHSVVKQTLQLKVPRATIDEEMINIVILKGIMKFNLFTTPMTEDSPQVIDLRQRIMALNTDDVLNTSALLEPQHGNRQAMASARFANANKSENNYQENDYQANALDIVEDNISVWMNEQPSNMYDINDKPTRNKLLKEVATNVQDKLNKKMPENEIKNELAQWLNKIVKPKMRRNVDGLAENLKDKIMALPQDETLTRAREKRINDRNESVEPEQHNYKSTEVDENLNEYIEKYMKHNYNVDDDIVNGVLKLMVKQEVYKLSPLLREELYSNPINDEFNTDKFRMELEIVQEICDWLRNIPFFFSVLKPGLETIEFVHSLARNIVDIEIERINYPDRMNYASWLHTEIATYMLQKDAAITNVEDKYKIDRCAAQLCLRIMNLRKDAANGPTDELYKIVTEHMKKYDTLMAKDYLKKILWHRRLADNVKKLLLGKPTASRADVEKALAIIPFPRDESVIKYKMEIKYNITIHDWLHGLQLVPITSTEEEHARKNRIQELLQKIIETDEKKIRNPHDDEADDDLDNYIAYWISHLQFETQPVNVPLLVSQLRSGLEYVKWSEKQPQRQSDIHVQGMNRSKQQSRANESKQKDPGEQMVEAVEGWCNDLPIKEDNEEAIKATKEQVATNIFQIVDSLGNDPRIANDNEKLKSILEEEIEAQLQNLSEHEEVIQNKDRLKAVLLNNVMEIKNTIRDKTAGDEYVHVLENSIDASLSNPLQRSNKNDPGYELFKKRTVMFWLLENYDYAVDFHSLKYKKILSEEIRSLSEEIQKRNLFPADKEEMMNDIMSALYIATPPNEDAIIEEIENIKLRCEIEVWANELPLKEALNYSKVLERDTILTILTKILFDLERSEESDADEQMRMEIMKWASKLPIISGEKNNLSRYADLLMCFLKASSQSRKCQRQPEPMNLIAVEETLTKLRSGDELGVAQPNQEHTSQVAGPSTSTCCKGECGASGEQLAFLIMKAINNWCIQLPIPFSNADEQNMAQRTKEQISQRLLQFVGILHYRPNTLKNEGLYEYYLNNELENILTELTSGRLYWEAQHGRNDRKHQLINALKAIRPLVQDVNDREQYKNKLKHTISSFHESMAPHMAVELSPNAQSAILDNFIQYKNHAGDFETQELYKLKINDALNNELNDTHNIDPLLVANRLICELSKVEPPKHSHRDKAHSPAQRRSSQPNPLGGISRLPSTAAMRRQSLPYPLLQNSCPKFAPSQNVLARPQPSTSYAGSAGSPRRHSAPLATSPPTSKRISPRRNSLQVGPQPPPIPRSQLIQQENISRQSTPLPPLSNLRPFPLPRPVVDISEESNTYQSPRSHPQVQYRQPESPRLQQAVPPDFAETSRERQPRVEQQSEPSGAGVRSRTTARARNSPRSTDCPEERRDRNIMRTASQEYCETCDRDEDCGYPGPYPSPTDYMYY